MKRAIISKKDAAENLSKEKSHFLKIPVEFCQFALKDGGISPAKTYLAGQFEFPGKFKIGRDDISKIRNLSGLKKSAIYDSYNWLLDRDWMGKDTLNGWYFFRGLDYIHQVEGWQYKRAVIMFPKDLKTCKAFFVSAVVSSAIKTGLGTRTGPISRRPQQARYPVPVSFLQETMSVSRRTAIRYFNIAKELGYIDKQSNLKQAHNLTPNDVKSLRQQSIDIVECRLSEHTDNVRAKISGNIQHAKVQSLRIYNGRVYVQGANLIKTNIYMSKR